MSKLATASLHQVQQQVTAYEPAQLTIQSCTAFSIEVEDQCNLTCGRQSEAAYIASVFLVGYSASCYLA